MPKDEISVGIWSHSPEKQDSVTERLKTKHFCSSDCEHCLWFF